MPRSRDLPSPLGPLRLHADGQGVYTLVFLSAARPPAGAPSPTRAQTPVSAPSRPARRGAPGAGFGGSGLDAPAALEAARPPPDAALDRVTDALTAYFAGTPLPPDLPLALRGTAFQHKVWAAVAAIPPGTTRTYTELARELRSGARAVGAANAANPLPLLVPCHRLVGADGDLCGYRGGLWAKRWLLDHEAGRTPP